MAWVGLYLLSGGSFVDEDNTLTGNINMKSSNNKKTKI